MHQIGLSDTSLQRELGTVRNPTLAAFSEKIEGFEKARRTISSSAYLVATLHLPHLAVTLDNPAVQLIVMLLLVGRGKETDTSLCAASASGVQSLIT